MAAIELNFYNADSEIIATHSVGFVPWKMLKKALAVSKSIAQNSLNGDADGGQNTAEYSGFDEISAFVCDLFQNKFSLAELEEHADIGDVMSCFRAVVNKAKSWGNA